MKTNENNSYYEHFLDTLSGPAWKRIGTQRRAGVVAPLFSIYSNQSIGIGDLWDLNVLVDWCVTCGISIIQLLPINDVGFNFRPYDAQSMFALDPMYLSLEHLTGVDPRPLGPRIKALKNTFPTGQGRVDYNIKKAKLKVLWDIYKTLPQKPADDFVSFQKRQAYWLDDYSLFKVIKELCHQASWESWTDKLRKRDPEALGVIRQDHREGILFQQWLQWQLFLQCRRAKEYAASQGVLLMGDIPFLVSRDSADVWAHQSYFKLDLSSGAPPDLLYASGQRWGMPPYQWENIAQHQYDYVIEKLRYAENFYDLYRIDHVVGIFRVWTIAQAEPAASGGLNGAFDPPDINAWEDQGRQLLSVMLNSSRMLACAEDLGTIPPCTFKVLEEFGIPGIDVQRWMRDWGKTYDFKDPASYRPHAMATIATHDMSSLAGWWAFEAGTVDATLFDRKCRERHLAADQLKERLFDAARTQHGRLHWKKEINTPVRLLEMLGLNEQDAWDFLDLYKGSFFEKKQYMSFLGIEVDPDAPIEPPFVKKVLQKTNASATIFSCQLIHDWLSLDSLFDIDPWEQRINFPGTLSDKNWSLVMPLSLDDMLVMPVNSVIKEINAKSNRI